MRRVNAKRRAESLAPVKPCDVFDLIGGTSTGGYVARRPQDGPMLTRASSSLIAIMLGRLEMTVEECIKAYTDMMGDVFGKRSSPIDWRLNVKGQFSALALERAIRSLVSATGHPVDALLDDPSSDKRHCRAYVLRGGGDLGFAG